MSLSLSNSLSFAQIPLVKIGENGKNSCFLTLQLQFHHEVGLIQRRYFELFSRYGTYFHHTKNQPRMRPASTFFKVNL